MKQQLNQKHVSILHLIFHQNQHTRQLISARNTCHKYNNKDLRRLR